MITKLAKKRTLGALEDYQAFVVPVAGQYSLLLTEMEVFRPTVDDPLREGFARFGRHLGLHIVMTSLLNQCVIHAHGLLDGNGGLEGRDPNKVSPSLQILAHPFLEKNEQSCAKLLKRLKDDPPPRPELILHLEGNPWRSSAHVRRPQSDFANRVKIVRDDWAFLKTKRK
jgi:hypothetical protein